MDRNGDGVLQADEIPDRARPFLRRIAEQAGLDPNGPIPLDRLASPGSASGNREVDQFPQEEGDRRDDRDEGDERRNGEERGDGTRRGDDRRRGDRSNDDAPQQSPAAIPVKVGGFAAELSFSKVPGFDVPHSVTSQSGPTVAELAQAYDGRIIRYAGQMMERADRNGNRIIDPNEWGDLRWRGDLNEMDLNRDGRLTPSELIQGIVKQRDVEPRDRSGERSERQQGERREPELQNDENGKTPGAENGTEPQKPMDEKVARAAREIIRRYDRNKDGVIDGRERERMRGDPRQIDSNADGVVTYEEVAQRLGQDNPPQEFPTDAATSRRRVEARRVESRSRSESERGRQGIPGWFRSRDKDGDGQVSMSEYASSWDERKAAEFAARDLNGDGVITSQEAT